MGHAVVKDDRLNYAPCRYGASRILFRGPQRRLDAPFVALLGSTETYGKFVKAPFPALLESDIGVNCVNFGICNAGVDVFLNDPTIIDAARVARVAVLQVVGAQNLSNRFYSVHPRRNDRFVSVSPRLQSIYPSVDFSEFHFNRHLLDTLHGICPERFAAVREELQNAWSARMKLLLGRIGGCIVLVRFANHTTAAQVAQGAVTGSGEPLFVTASMVNELREHVDHVTEIDVSAHKLKTGTHGMIFGEAEANAAEALMGPAAHAEAARELGRVLEELM